jgi:hypothetical protein
LSYKDIITKKDLIVSELRNLDIDSVQLITQEQMVEYSDKYNAVSGFNSYYWYSNEANKFWFNAEKTEYPLKLYSLRAKTGDLSNSLEKNDI